MRCGVVRFSSYKTANRIAPCGVVRYGALLLAVRCGAVMPFCGWFWCGFCSLCDLVNTPNGSSICGSGLHFFFSFQIYSVCYFQFVFKSRQELGPMF